MKIYLIITTDPCDKEDILFAVNTEEKAENIIKYFCDCRKIALNQFDNSSKFEEEYMINNPVPKRPEYPRLDLSNGRIPSEKEFIEYRNSYIEYRNYESGLNEIKLYYEKLNEELKNRFPKSEWLPKIYTKYFEDKDNDTFSSLGFGYKEIEVEAS